MDELYKLDDAVKFKLRTQIYLMEKENQKTKRLSDKAMKDEIIKIIEKEVRKCY